MKTQLLFCLAFLSAVFTLSSCVYKVIAPAQLYAPTLVPAPMLEKKGDLHTALSVTYSGDQQTNEDGFLNFLSIGLFPDVKVLDDIYTFNLNGTYAVGPHFALTGNVMGGSASRTYDFLYFDGSTDYRIFERRYQYLDAELGAGPYWSKPYGKGQLRSALFGGGGIGKSDLSAHLNRRVAPAGELINDVLGSHTTTYRKFFAQSYVGYATKYFEIGGLARFTRLHYALDETVADSVRYAASTRNQSLLEPGLFLAFGGEKAKIRFQYQRLIPFERLDFPTNDNYFSMVFDVNLGKAAAAKP